jgi:N-acyl-D-aspartate/D-glutamate deacylase
MHTHCDGGLGRPDANANLNYLIQGTTTVVTGNCGDGTFEVAEIKDKWEKQGIGTNAVHLVGFGTARREVMGREPRLATPEEIEKMKAIVRKAMKEGAWGMSSGLEYVPQIYASTEEVIEVTKVVGEYGGIYSSHQRNEFDGIVESTKETIRIAEEAGVRGNAAHFKACRKNAWGTLKVASDLITEARKRGIYVTADMYPYEKAGGTSIISVTRNAGLWTPFRVPEDMEPFAEMRKKMRDKTLSDVDRKKLRDQYFDELAKALSNKSKREQIKQAVLVGDPENPSGVPLVGWDSYGVTVVSEKNSDLIGKILSDIAKEQNRDPFDLVAELIIDEPNIRISAGVMGEDDMKYAMKQDWLMFSSDGGASRIIQETDEPSPGHPRAFASQARVLRKYVREDKVLTLENAVRMMTSLPADLLQMKDRGLLKKGYKADIAIFDPDTITDNATFADARQYSTGTEYVIVNGKISIENGEYDGALDGKLLLLTENK